MSVRTSDRTELPPNAEVSGPSKKTKRARAVMVSLVAVLLALPIYLFFVDISAVEVPAHWPEKRLAPTQERNALECFTEALQIQSDLPKALSVPHRFGTAGESYAWESGVTPGMGTRARDWLSSESGDQFFHWIDRGIEADPIVSDTETWLVFALPSDLLPIMSLGLAVSIYDGDPEGALRHISRSLGVAIQLERSNHVVFQEYGLVARSEACITVERQIPRLAQFPFDRLLALLVSSRIDPLYMSTYARSQYAGAVDWVNLRIDDIARDVTAVQGTFGMSSNIPAVGLLRRNRTLGDVIVAGNKFEESWDQLVEFNAIGSTPSRAWRIRSNFTGNAMGGRFVWLHDAVLGEHAREIQNVRTRYAALEVVIAIRAYECKHRVTPPDLATLVPEFLPEVPRVSVTLESFQYQRDARSVGYPDIVEEKVRFIEF